MQKMLFAHIPICRSKRTFLLPTRKQRNKKSRAHLLQYVVFVCCNGFTHLKQKRKKTEDEEEDRDEMPTWKVVIASKDAIIASKDAIIASKDETLASKDEALASKDKAMKLAEEALAHAKARISALKAEVLVAKGLVEPRFVIDHFFVLELEYCVVNDSFRYAMEEAEKSIENEITSANPSWTFKGRKDLYTTYFQEEPDGVAFFKVSCSVVVEL
jgi:hypothetical protein